MAIWTAQQAYDYAKKNKKLIFPEDIYISPHFKWNEVFVNELPEYGIPELWVFQNAQKASIEFEKVRVFLGKAMNVHCWFRSLLHNLAVKKQGLNPAMHSSHLYAMAIDYDVEGMTPAQVRAKLLEGVKSGKLKIRIEPNTSSWVHNDIGNPYINDYKWGLIDM